MSTMICLKRIAAADGARHADEGEAKAEPWFGAVWAEVFRQGICFHAEALAHPGEAPAWGMLKVRAQLRPGGFPLGRLSASACSICSQVPFRFRFHVYGR